MNGMGDFGAALFQALDPTTTMNTTMNTTQDKTIWVRVKHQYGIDRVFPADPTAILFSRLIGQKTFTHRDLCLIEELGYTIQTMPEPMKYVRENKQ